MPLRVEAETVIYVNNKVALEKIEGLKKKAQELREQMNKIDKDQDPKGFKNLERQLNKVDKQLQRIEDKEDRARIALMELDKATPRELYKYIKMINTELNSGRVERGSKEWNVYVSKLKEAKAELRKVKAEMDVDQEDDGLLSKIKNSINGWGATAAVAMGAFAGVSMAGKEAVQAYADMQAEEANVRKYTGMTEEEVNKLNDAFKKMDTRTSREELNKLAQEAGRLGKNNVEDVLGFVKAADQINVALDDLGEGATLTLSKLTGIFGDEKIYGTEQSLLKVGSVINELSQNCSASAPYLAEFSSRLGGIAAQSKMNISQVMAFAAVLDTQNLNLEASATAVGQLITSIYQEPAKIAKAAGMDVEEFSKLVKTDMNGALIALFEQLQKFGGMENLASVFDQMGTDGARAIPVLTALSGHVEELKAQQAAANVAFQEGTSITKEYDVQNNTVQAGLDKAKKQFTEMAVSLGEKLVPVMRMCISGTSMLMRVMNELIGYVAKHPATITTMVLALGAYSLAVKGAAIEQAALTLSTKLHTIAQKAWNVACGIGRVTIGLFTKGLKGAKAANDAFTASAKKSVWGWIIVLVGALITKIVSFIESMEDADEKLKQQAEEAAEFKKSITDLNEGMEQYSKDEISRLKMLYEAATNDKLSKKMRIEAANDLIKTYPDQFKNMNAELIILGKAKTAYDNLTTSILNNAKAKAAQDKIEENSKIIFDFEETTIPALQKGVKDAQAAYKKALDDFDKANERTSNSVNLAASSSDAVATIKAGTDAERDAVKAAANTLKEAQTKLKTAQNQLAFTRNETNKFIKKYGMPKKEEPDANPVVPTVGPSEKELKSAAAAQRKAEAARGKAAQEAKDALKKDLDEQTALYNKAVADNLAAYVLGQKNYLEYQKESERLEQDNVDKVLKIHEEHNLLDVVAYSAALKKKSELQKKRLDEARKMEIDDLERTRRTNRDDLTSLYLTPGSNVYQDDRWLKQALFEEDVRFLQKKAELYEKGSKERADIEREIEDMLAQDKLDKQRETAEAYAAFEKQYRNASGSAREQMEIAMMDELHKQGLISEEEHQRAIQDIKDKYRKEDADKRNKATSEYTDMINNLYTSFSRLFANIGKEGADSWGLIADAATAAFAFMSAGLQQYSTYAKAEQDLELAQVERRYDREIKAAGKNEKKKTRLEKQKEEELARIKKKHNDKAMKIELAQAFAQTALAAINAYASGSKISVWMGPIAAAMATAAGMIQIAAIQKQHQAQAAGFYAGGFTARDADNRREVGVVHANEFVANHEAVANPALAPVLRLIDHAQRNNTVGSLSAADVSRAIGTSTGVGAGGASANSRDYADAMAGAFAVMADVSTGTRDAINRLSDNLENGIEAFAVLDGENGFHRKYEHYKKLINNPKR